MAIYLRWFLTGEDVWCYDELDEARWSQRHIEQRERDDVFLMAASLREELHARDTGGPSAVFAYWGVYGATPEAPLTFPPDDAAEYRVTAITAQDFNRIWSAARTARESGYAVRPFPV